MPPPYGKRTRDTRMQKKPPEELQAPFSIAIYHAWCRVWLHVQNYQTRLANQMGQLPYLLEEEPFFALARDDLGQALSDVLSQLDSGGADDSVLTQAHVCLLELETRQRAAAQRHWQVPPEVNTGIVRHVLIPSLRCTARAGDPDQLFHIRSELGIDRILGLGYRWLPLPQEVVLDWRAISQLVSLRGAQTLRIGLAPCATKDDMIWRLDPQDKRAPDARVPMQCSGSHDLDRLWAVVQKTLEAAWAKRVQVLLFPELVMDDVVLQRCRNWLETHNLRENRLHLVVAGSRHVDNGDGSFSNRCTVLGQLGDILWEQDKRTPFVIDDPKTLKNLSSEPIALAVEPTKLGPNLVLAETAVGRLLTPICLDYIEGDLWRELGADFYLVPAMSPKLVRFENQAKAMGGLHGAATIVCNAQTAGNHRCLTYLPVKSAPKLTSIAGTELFTIDVPIDV